MTESSEIREVKVADARTPRPDPATYDYTKPGRNCDIVMKGGITSGVIYPFAVCEIAQTYRFKSIGGASAGAIAAAATAAAEHGRPEDGFTKLSGLPAWLGEESNLFDLFKPQPGTRRLFGLFTAPIGVKVGKIRKILGAAATNFLGWLVLGSLLGLVLLVVGLTFVHGFAGGLLIGMGITLSIVGALVGVVVGIYRSVTHAIAANGFGLCSGMGDESAPVPPLTSWLAETIDELAGPMRPPLDPTPVTELATPPSAGGPGPVARGPEPLAFGHLWLGRDGTGREPGDPNGEPSVNLQMMTTNLSEGRPYRLPFDTRGWYFLPEEFRGLFPKRIVAWMEEHPPPLSPEPARARWQQLERKLLEPLKPLPTARHLPVVVAARMSLSFPLLICAVPLYAIDWSLEANQESAERWRDWLRGNEDWEELAKQDRLWADARKETGEAPRAAVHWFSDGGITSNFPVHFFDAPIPRWPTFGINLRDYHPDYPPGCDECKPGQSPCDQHQSVWMPKDNRGGILVGVRDIQAVPGIKPLVAFGHSIVDTMQNWSDNTQMRVPGYRDRVAHVYRTKDEGGINLNMPSCRIDALTERGRCAGEELVRRFSSPVPEGVRLTWDNHRWVRYRTTMALLQEMLSRFRRAFREIPISGDDRYPAAGDPSYQQLLDADPSPSYPLDGLAALAKSATADVMRASETWDRMGSLGEEAPGPPPELRIRPRV